MGNLLRRVLAFVLGMVFTIASASASVVGGAYWAYKNIKPVGIASDDPGLGDLRDQTIEDLMFLLNGAMNNPDKYTLARLEAEYGLDLEKLLKNLGIENVDKDSDNWQALTAISLFSLKDGLPALLSQIKLRALYNFLPSLTGKRLKDLLSPEAQEKLGDYTLMELFESDEETGETGIVKAIKNIKLGALLPAYFDGEFDEDKHEYNYVLADNEEAQALPVLGVFGNVSLGVISSLISGGDIMAELMEGSLSSISEMPIEDIISSIAKTVSPELGEKISSYAKFLNGARIKDLFYKNDGKWEFYYAKVLGNLKVGYLFGLEENEEGVWVDKDGKPAKDLMQVLAGLDINTLVSGNDTFTMIRDLIGDVNIGMVLDMLGIEEGEIPFMDAIRGIQVGELLKNQGAEFDANVFVKDFIANLADSLGDRTLGELIFKEGEEPTDANAIVKALFNLRLSDFIKEEYTLESVIAALRNALGDVSVGDVLGIKRNSDGTWNTDDKVLALILDFSFDNIFDVLTSDYSAKEVIKKLFPETKVGDLVCAFMGFEVNEENGRYYKENDGEKKYLSNELSELFDCKLADLAAGLLDRGDPFDSYEQLAKPMLGDLIDFVATWLGTDIKELNYVVNENGDGEYEWEGEPVDAETPVGATSRLLSISVAEFVKDIANGGSDLISKDIEEYISIAGALVRFIAKSGGYTGDIDGMTKSVVDLGCYLFDGKLYGFGLNYYAKIPVLADLTKTVAEKFIPAGTVLNTVSQLFDEIGKLYENSVIDTFLADTMALEVDGIVSALGEIVKKATPDNAEKVDHITALIKELIDGQVSGFGIDYTAKVRTLAEQAKAIADDYLPEGTAKNVVDEFFDQVGVLYPETTLDTFLSDMMSLDVDDIAGSLGEIVKKATPDNAEKVAHIVTLVQELIVGQVSGFGLDYSAKISTLAEESKTIADDYLPEGAAKNVVDELFDQIGVLYPETTLDTFVEDTAVIGVDNVITSLGEVVKKGTPDNAEKVAHVTDLINYVLAGELSGFGIDYYAEITGISDRARLIAYDYVSDGKVKDVISAVFDEINTLYPTSTIDSFVVDTNKMRFDTAIESLSRILKVALPDYEEQLDAITKLVVLVVDGRVVRPGWDLRVLMDDVIVATGDVVKSFWKDGAKKIDAIVALATLVVDGKLGYPCLDLRPEMDEVIVTAGTVVKAFWEDGEEQIDAIVNLATMLVDGKLSYPCIDLRNDVDGVIIAVADVIKSFWKDGEKKIDAIVDLATMVVDGRLSFPVWDLRHRIDDVIVVAGDVVKAFWEDGSSKADAVVNLLTVLLDGKAYKPGWDLTVYVTDVTAAVDKVLTEFGLDKSAPEVYKYIDVIFGELDTLYEGVKLKYFVSATVNAEFDIAVDLAARLVHAFYPAGDKYAEPIGEFVKLIIGGKVGRPMVDLTVYVTEVTASLRNILAAFGYKLTDDDYVSTVLAEVDSLYEGKKLKHFVAASANLEFDAVVNSFVNIAVRVMQDVYPDGIKYVKSIEQFVTLLIGGKISRPMFDLTIYVTEVTASVRNLLTTFVFTEYAPETENYEAGGIALLADTTEGTQPDGVYGYIDAVFNEIDSLYAGVKLKHFVAASANLEFDAVVDSVANIATKVLNDVYPDGVKYIEPVTTFVKVLIGGKISAPMLDLTAKVNEVTDSLCALIDTFVPQNDITDIITDILDEIGRQYHGVMLKDFASSTLSADFDKAVVTLADIAKIAWPDGAKYIDAVANFLITMIDGKVCEPKLDLTVTVDEVIDRINELLDVLEVKGTAREITDFAFKEILSFYSGVTLQGIPEKSKSIEFDDVVDSVVRIIVKIAPEQEENVKPIAELVKLLIGGPVISPKLDLTVYVNDVTDRLYNVILIFKLGDDLNGKINVVLSGFGDLYNNVRLKDFVEATKDLYVARVIAYVESVTNAFGLKSEILDTIYTELKDLYKDAQIRYFVDETLNLDIDETIMSLATIVKSFKAVGDDKVDAITNLATMLLKGTVGKPEIDKDVIIVELADAFDNFYSLIIEGHVEVLDNVINELITQVKTLYPNSSNTIGTFVDDSLKLDVDVVIESVRKVFAHIEATSKITDRIAKLASAALDGTLGDLKFNLDAFLEEATTTEILIIGGVILVTGTILYFVANETLIKIVDAVLGKDCKLGTLIAEPMGYTVDGETYTFEGKENDLANTLFNLTVQNVLTKGFDFKSVFEDKLYIDDIAMMAKAVESKYAPDEVKSIADVALDVIADLYNETHVKDFVSATVGMETSAAFGGVAKIVNAATKNKYEETVNAIEKLLSDAIGGKFNALELPNRQTTVDELVSDIEGVTNAFGFKNAILTEVYEQLCKLYQGELLIYFVDVTCSLELDAVIVSTGEIVKSTEVLTGETIDTIVDLAQYLVDGIVSKPEFNMDAEIAEIAKKLNAITDRFELGAATAYVECVFEQVTVLFPTTTIKTFVNDAKELELDAVIGSAAEIFKVTEVLTGETVDTIVDLAQYLAEGTVSKPGFNMDAEIAEIARKLNAITDRFELGAAEDWVDFVLEQVAVLFPTSTIKTVGKDVANIELDAIIDTLGAAVETANLLTKETVDTIVDLAQYFAEGTVSKPGFNMDAEIAEIARKLNAITDRFELGAADAYVDSVLEQIAKLFPTSTIKTFVGDAKELELDAVIGSLGEIFKATELLTGETVDTIIDFAQYLAEGTVSKPGFNMDAEIAEITRKLNAITDRFELGAADAWVDLILEQIAKLFPTSTIKTFAKDAAKIELDAVVDTFGEAIKTAELLTDETVDTIVDFAQYLAEGTVSKPGFNMDAEIAEIAKKLNAITDRFELGAADACVDSVLEQIAKLFPTSTIKTFVGDAKELELDAVIGSLGEIFKATELLTGETVDTIIDFAQYLAEGTVSKPGFNMDAEIAEITRKLNAITDRFELGAADAWVDLILEQIAKLFPTSTIKTFAKDAAKIELDAVVDTFGEAIKTAELLTDETVDTIVDFAQYLAEGTVSKPGFNMDAEIAVIAEKVNAVTDRFKLGAAKAWVDVVLEQVGVLFPTSTIKTVAKDAAKIELDAVVDTFGEAVKTASLLKDLTVDTIADLAKYLAEGTVSKPAFNMDAEIAVIAEKVNAVTDRFKLGAAKAWVDVVLEQVGVLFPTSTIKTVAKDAANIELDNIITAVANIVKTGKFTKDAIIDAIADLAKELVDGTIKSPKLNSDALVNDVAAKLTAIIDEIEMNANLKKALKAIIDGIGELYDGVKVKDFVAETMNRSLDSIIDYIEKVVVTAFDGDTTEARGRRFAARTTDNKSIIRKVNVICDLLRLLADGTVKAPAIDKEITVDQVVNSLKAVTDEFALKHEILTTVYTEIAALYENAKVVKFVDATLALELDNVITAVANIIKSIKFVGDDKVDAVSALAKVLAAGTIKAPKLDDNAKIIEIADAFDKLYSLIVEGKVELLDNIINEIIAQVNGLYTSETTIKSFVADSKKLDVDETIESVRKVFAHIEAISKVTDRIATLASAALKGTFAELEFEFDELMKVATTTEKIIGGAIVLGVGTVLYFVANETLLSITDKALGPDRTIGSLCAEYLGYTVADDKYTFEDEENELANTLFTLKVHDALTKGYDFKARFEDKLYIDDIALFAKAIESKYAPDDIKSIVNVVLDVIADLYDETHVKDFVSATVEMEITKVFNAVASIVNAATKDAYRDKVDAIAALLCDVIVGKLSAPDVPNKELLITEAVADVENITDAFDLKYNALTEAYSQLKKLYEGKKVVDFVDATKELAIDDVIGSTCEVTKASKVVKEAIVNDIVDLAQYVLTGKVSKPEFSGKAKIAEIANKVKTFVNEFNLGAAKAWIDCILDQVGVLLPTATIKTVGSEVKEIEIDAVIYSAGEIFKVSKLRTAKTVDAYVDFVQYIVTGKVVKPQFDGDAQIAEIANKAKAIAARYKLGKAKEWIDCVLDEIGALLPTATIKTVGSEVKEIEIDAVIGSAGEIFKVSKLLKNLTVDTIVDLAKYVVTGKVVKPQFDGDAQIAEIASKIKAVINRFDFNSPKGIILCTLDQIGILLPTATIRTVKDDVLNIELDALLEATGNVVKYPVFIKDELVETIVVLAQELADGTIRSPKFNSAAYVETVADEVNAIIDTFEVNNTAVKVVKAIIGGLGDLYTGVQLKDFVTETMNRSLDGIIDYLEEVIVTALGGETSTQSRRLAKAAKNNSSVIAKVNVICDLLRLIADGTVKSPAVDKNVTVNETVEKVQTVTDEFKAKHAVLTAVYEELKALYNDAKLVKIKDATLALELDNIINSVANIVKSTKAIGNEKIDAIAELAKELANGTVKSPKFNGDALVSTVATDVNGIIKSFKPATKVGEITDAALTGLGELYDGVSLKDFAGETLNRELDGVIAYIEKVTLAITEDKTDTIVTDVAAIMALIADGTLKAPAVDKEVTVDAVVSGVQTLTDDLKVKYDVLTAVYEELKALYNDAKLVKIKDATLALELDNVLGSVANIFKATKLTSGEKIDAIADLAKLLVTGTIKAPKFDMEVSIVELTNAVDVIYSLFVEGKVQLLDDVVNEIFTQINVLYSGETTFNRFVADSKKLDIDDTIESVRKVFAHIDAISKITDRIAELASVTFDGTFESHTSDMNALMNEATTTEKIIGGAVILGVGTILYFVANPTLLKITDKALGADRTIGSLVAEHLGYTVADDKYTFEDEENELANALFTLKVHDALTKGYDFKARFEDKLYVDDIAMIAKAIESKYLPADVKSIADIALDVIAETYDEIHVKDFVSATVGMEMAKVFHAVAMVVNAATKDEYKVKVDAIEALLGDVIVGKISAPEVPNKELLISETVTDVENITNAFDFKYDALTEAYNQLKSLYEDKKLTETVDATKELEIDAVLGSAGEVIKASKVLKAGTLNAVVDLAQYVLTGKVVKPQFSGKAQIAEIANKTKLIANRFDLGKAKPWVNCILDQVGVLLPTAKIKTVGKEIKEIEIDAVIEVAGNIFKTADLCKDETVNAFVELVQYIITGKVVKPQFDGDAEIAEIANKAKTAANRFDLGKAKPWVDCVLDQVGVLLPTATIRTFVGEVKEIEIDTVIYSAGEIFKVSKLRTATTVDKYVDFAQYILTGKVVKPQFDGDAQIAEIANKAKAIAKRYKLGKAQTWVEFVLDQVGVLFPTSIIRTVGKDVKEIEIDAIIDVAGNALKTAKVYKDGTIDTITDLAKYIVTGKVVKPQFDGDAQIAEIANKANAVVNRFKFGKAKPWVDCVLDQIGMLYAEATIKTFVESSKNIELQKLLASVKAITGVANGLNDKLAFIYKVLEASLSGTIAKPGFDFAKAFSMLSNTEKSIVIGIGTALVITMYYFANPLFVKIASKVFKENETWGDRFAKSLGYAFDETQNRYMRTDDLYNALVDTWLGMKIVESLKTEYKIIDKLSAYITIGNIITSYKDFQAGIEKGMMKGANFYAEGDKWMICRLSFDHLEDIVLNTSLKEILDNKKSLKTFLFNKIDSLTIADFGVGSFIRVYGKGSKIKGFKATAEYDAVTEKWTFDGSFNELFDVLLNCTIGDMRQIKQKYGSFKNYVLGGMENLVVGDILGYALNMANEMSNNKLKITAAKDEARGWTVEGKFAQVLNRFVNINLKELYDNLKSNMKDYISSEKLVGGIRIGELLDGGYNVYDTTTDKWSNEKGEMTFRSGLYGMLIKKIYTIQLGEFMTGKGYNISKLTEDTYLGDVFKFTCNHNGEIGHKHTALCKWFETKSVKTAVGEASVEMLLEVDAVYGALSSMSLNELIDGEDVLVNIKKLTLGDMMGYVKELEATGEYTYYEVLKDGGVPVVEVVDGYAYKRAGEKVSKLTGTLAKVKVDTLMSGEGVDEIMNEIEKLQLGDILRYTYDESASVWKNGETEITGILAAFCDHTLAELKDPDKIKDIVNDLKLKDVLGEDAVNGNAVLVHLGNTKIGKLSERINNMYIGEVLEYSSTVKKHGEYDIYTDSNSVEYYNDSAMSEGGVFAGYWKKVEDGVEDYTMSKEPDTVTGRYKSTDNRYLSLAHTWKKTEADGIEKDVTGVTAVLANFRISELDDPDFNTRLDSAIDNLKLGNVIAIDNSSPVILKELANTKLKDVSEQIELIKVGTLMGYAYNEVDGKWYNGGSALTDSFTIKIANHTIKEVSSGSFSDMLAEDFKTIKVSKVMAKSDCTLFAIMSDSEYNELTIDNMGGKLNDKLANVTLGDAVTIGVLDGTLFNTKGDAIRIAYNAESGSNYGTWNEIPAKVFLKYAIEKAFENV